MAALAGSALEIVGFAEPVGERRLDLVAVADLDVVPKLRLRGLAGAADAGRLQLAAEEDADFQELFFGRTTK